MRARTQALVAFRRPDALRLEIPGALGVRLVAVACDGELTAVFPADRAVFQGTAEAAEMHRLLGVGLAPSEVMDLLVGVPSPRLRRYSARWGAEWPRRIQAELPDGARLRIEVEDVEAGAPPPTEAFAPPPHHGFRRVDATEARELWGRR